MQDDVKVAIDQYDTLLDDKGPAAIVMHRKLMPAEGKNSWIFPPTFAQSESADDDEDGGGAYQIDDLPNDARKNVCLIDSIGSQANRIEPIFKTAPYSALVPQMTIRLKNGDEVNILDAGHRAADAVVRFSKILGPSLSKAFKQYREKRDCSELVKLAPTSLIFGVWDSRATGAKIQRIARSIIRAYNVTEAKRSATYQAAYDYTGNEMIDPKLDKGTGKNNPLSQEGFKYSLATGTHGGVLAYGDIQQEAIINLVALRTLSEDMATKRYLLGLALVALSYRDQQGFNLREGCLLLAATKPDFDGVWKVVKFDSTDDTEILRGFTHDVALAYTQETVKGIQLNKGISDTFDKITAEEWLAIDKKERKKLAKTKHPAKALADKAAAAAKTKDGESSASHDLKDVK
jgi:CRISPR-associated protein Csb1